MSLLFRSREFSSVEKSTFRLDQPLLVSSGTCIVTVSVPGVCVESLFPCRVGISVRIGENKGRVLVRAAPQQKTISVLSLAYPDEMNN